MNKINSLMMSLFLATASPFVNAMVVYDPATDADMLNEIAKSESQIENQIEQIENQKKMLEENPFKTLVDYENEANSIANMAQYGQAITYQTENLENTFNERFGIKPEEQSFDDYNNSINQTTLDTTQGTLKSAQEQMRYLADQTGNVNNISNQNNGVTGTTAQLQGISHMMNAQATQLQAMQQLQAQNNAQQATYMAAQTAKEAQQTKADTDWMAYEAEYPVYSTDEALEEIPTI